MTSSYTYHAGTLYLVSQITIRNTTFTWQVTLTLSAVTPTGGPFDNCQSSTVVDDYLEFLSDHVLPLSIAQQRYPEYFL